MNPRWASDLARRSSMMPSIRSSETSAPEAMIGAACWPSSVPSAIASRSMSPVEMCGMACWAASRFACVPFPLPGGPMKMMFRAKPLSPPPADPAALHEPVIVAHDQLRLDLLDRIHGHAHHDQQRRAAEVEVEPHSGGEPVLEEPVEPRPDPERDLGHVDA